MYTRGTEDEKTILSLFLSLICICVYVYIFSISKSPKLLLCHCKGIYNTFNINFYIELVLSSKILSLNNYFKLTWLFIKRILGRYIYICTFQ